MTEYDRELAALVAGHTPDRARALAAAWAQGRQALALAALAVCDRWDADDVNAGLMNRDIARLRHLAENTRAEH
jgi:hypothetical protein